MYCLPEKRGRGIAPDSSELENWAKELSYSSASLKPEKQEEAIALYVKTNISKLKIMVNMQGKKVVSAMRKC